MHKILLFTLTFWVISCGPKENQPIVQEESQNPKQRSAIEFITKTDSASAELRAFLSTSEHESYQWKNHFVLFGEGVDELVIPEALTMEDTDLVIKRYDAPMYLYDKNLHCPDKTIAPKWKNYLLTANLVADTTMQNQYVAYHDTQFEKWPEVAAGFCNANFQQLLVFKNDRQLLLVISIPADKTLDQLDPLTLENNPKMVEWNGIMGKFQEGIEGTVEGETWVFLEDN